MDSSDTQKDCRVPVGIANKMATWGIAPRGPSSQRPTRDSRWRAGCRARADRRAARRGRRRRRSAWSRMSSPKCSHARTSCAVVRSSEAIATLSPAIDCALLDLGLPDASGLDAVAQLRSHAPAIPLIVLTGLADEAAGVTAVQAGAQDYLLKGQVDGHQLARSIRYSIGRRQAEEAELRAAAGGGRRRWRSLAWNEGLAPKPLLDDPSVWVASRYRAGRSRALLGGDFFDLVQTTDDSLHVRDWRRLRSRTRRSRDRRQLARRLASARPGGRPARAWSCRPCSRCSSTSVTSPACSRRSARSRSSPIADRVSMIRAGHPRPVLIDASGISRLSNGRGNAGIGVTDAPWLRRAGDVCPRHGRSCCTPTGSSRASRRGLQAPRRRGAARADRRDESKQRPNWQEQPWHCSTS